jgi:hypothetical protein
LKFNGHLAKYKVIALSAYLYKYSILSRETKSGNVVQVMINSVNRGLEPPYETVNLTQMQQIKNE